MSQHRIRLGDLILSDGADPGAAGNDYSFAVYGENFTTGQPEPIEVTIATLLQDGARVVKQGDGNREVAFRIEVGGADSASLARGEEALAAFIGIRTELGITPPDGWAPESVFDVETSSFGHDYDDLAEVQQGVHVYSIRLVCQPYVRTAELETVAAVPVSTATPVVSVIDAGTATTRWYARIGVLSDQGAFLRVSGTKFPRANWVLPSGTPAFDLTGRRFVSLDVRVGPDQVAVSPYLTVNGLAATKVASVSGVAPGFTRHTFLSPSNSAGAIEFGVEFSNGSSYIDFTNLTASNAVPYIGTTKQTNRTVSVAGSARTQGSLALAATSGTLGTTLVYTTTESTGAVALHPYRITGSTQSVSGSAVSGTTEVLAGSQYLVPVSDIARGKHQLVVRLNAPSTAPLTVGWTVRLYTSAGYSTSDVSGSTVVTPAAAGFGVFAIDNINLPSIDVPVGSPAKVHVVLGGAAVMDEAWLFNLDVGALTWIEAGSQTRAWIETANLDRPTPAVYLGTQADRSDAYGAYDAVRSWGTHTFKGTTSVLMVTTGSAAVESSFTYYPRYFNFVPTAAA